MDAIDRQIIHHLAAEGRMSFAALGRLVKLSTPAVHQRVRRLEARGVITGYGARVGHRSEEHTSELQSLRHLVCRLLLEKKKKTTATSCLRRNQKSYIVSYIK